MKEPQVLGQIWTRTIQDVFEIKQEISFDKEE